MMNSNTLDHLSLALSEDSKQGHTFLTIRDAGMHFGNVFVIDKNTGKALMAEVRDEIEALLQQFQDRGMIQLIHVYEPQQYVDKAIHALCNGEELATYMANENNGPQRA